jgi:SAM-dependent methyltransferase
MSLEDVIGIVSRWLVATEALAAVGAELSLLQMPDGASPDVAEALRAVSTAAGLTDLATLPPPQRQMLLGLVRLSVHQSVELLDDPARSPGWTFTDPAILEGWGRGSMVVPGALKAAAPELADVRTFLDVGTGVGLLAIAATSVWTNATVVGMDVWEPSLQLARANVRAAGLDDRVTIREQNVLELEDTETYDCAWLPTFFFTETVLVTAMPRLCRALKPGGWLVLGRMTPPPDPLAAATARLRIIYGGGAAFSGERLRAALEDVGCANVRLLSRQGPVPLDYTIGQRPTGGPQGLSS